MTTLTRLVAGVISRLTRSSPTQRTGCPFDFSASGGIVPPSADHPLTVRPACPVTVYFPDVAEGAD